MKIYESRHLEESGFFQYLFQALRASGAEVVEKAPHERQGRTDRHHEGAWAEIEGALVFFDMSDHVFDFDLQALQHADLYLKANLNRSLADRVLTEEGMADCSSKIRPFTFLPPSLGLCRKIGGLKLGSWLPGPKLFHVVGVYENPIADGAADPFEAPGDRVDPHVMHFWIRHHFSKAVGETGLSAISRLTSRGNPAIEDGVNVKANLNHQFYLFRMATSTCTVLNTFPHAVYPWKAQESLALGRPFIVEREPLIEIPPAFRPVPDEHFLEVIPGFGSFDENASLEEAASYRILKVPSLESIQEGFERITGILKDRSRMESMRRACRDFSAERFSPSFIVRWLQEEVSRSV